MKQFDEFSELWQEQQTTLSDQQPFIESEIMEPLKKFEKKWLRESWTGIWTLLGTCVFLGGAFALTVPKTMIFAWVGVGILIMNMIWISYMLWKSRFKVGEAHWGTNSRLFLQETLEGFSRRRWMSSQIMPMYGAMLILAINLIYVDILSPASLGFRIFAHSLTTGLMFFLMWISIKQYLKKFDEETAGVKADLQKLLVEWEE